MRLETSDDTHVVLGNLATATRVRLSLRAYQFLRTFQSPRRIEEAVPAAAIERLLPLMGTLVRKHVLVDADGSTDAAPVRTRTAVPYRFCNSPALSDARAPRFVVLGVPNDLSAGSGDRRGPEMIRRKSLDFPYRLQFADGRPQGWFDADRGDWILEGATIADAGDVHIQHGERSGEFVERLRSALGECCADGSIPLVIGGDRMVTLAVAECLGSRGGLTILRMALRPERSDTEDAHRLAGLSMIERVVYLDHDLAAGTASIDGLLDRLHGPGRIVPGQRDTLPVHLSIDLDLGGIVRDGRAQGRNAAVPALLEMKNLIAAVGRRVRIIGIDLVGLDALDGQAALLAEIGCQLALTAMNAVHDRD